MVDAVGLKKAYGSLVAVDGIDLSIGTGEIFGLLGPNGAGKSTAISMLCGLTVPDHGTVTYERGGSPLDSKTRSLFGIVPQSLAVYDDLSAEENLAFCASLYGLSGAKRRERIAWSLDLAGLTDRRHERIAHFSGGMKRRLNLACGLVHEPKIVFMDEPTVGVDPQSRNFIFDAIERLQAEGLTICYTTHYMEEAERLCDRVAIIDHGRLLAVDTVDRLVERFGGLSLVVAELEQIPADFALAGAEFDGRTVKFGTTKPYEEVAKIAAMSLPIRSLRIDRPNLESVFLALTGRKLRDQ